MAELLNTIIESFPIRNSLKQKREFEEFALEKGRELGFDSTVKELSKHRNICFGNVENARLLFCAHYDTPQRAIMPNLMLPTNKPLHLIYTLGIILPILIVSIGAMVASEELFGVGDVVNNLISLIVYTIVYVGLFLLLFMGPANKHNSNDNTSGVAAVLGLMERLGARKDIAFVLFDDEEKGKKGSAALAKAYPRVKSDTMVINLDCVGNGQHFVVSVGNKMAKHSLYSAFVKSFEGSPIPSHIYVGRKASLNSDHRNFNISACICACRYNKFAGYYTPYIHTSKDTVSDSNNINALVSSLAAFANSVDFQ